jgi:hypothetical protein
MPLSVAVPAAGVLIIITIVVAVFLLARLFTKRCLRS